MTDKIYSMLGLATKAGKLLAGSDVCEHALKSGKVKLVIISLDASELTKKRFIDACKYRDIQYRIFGDRYSLGSNTGKHERVVFGLCDENFSKEIVRMIDSLISGGDSNGKNQSI